MLLSEVAVLQVVNHLRYAPCGEAYAGNAAGHSLHDGVGQVLVQRGDDVEVGCIVDLYQPLLVSHIAHVVYFEGDQRLQFRGMHSYGQ